jgi:hypothetical protein
MDSICWGFVKNLIQLINYYLQANVWNAVGTVTHNKLQNMWRGQIPPGYCHATSSAPH